MSSSSDRIYLVGGLGLHSSRPLPGLPVVASASRLLDLQWSADELFDERATKGFREALGGGLTILSTETAVKIRGPMGFQFEYRHGENSARIWSGNAAGLSLTHSLADAAVPYVLSVWGSLVLHGAGLATENGSIAVLGETMTGKSTLTGRWVKEGRQFLSDDWLAVEARDRGYVASPSHPSIRLRALQPDLVDLSGVACQPWRDAYAKHWLTFDIGSSAYPGDERPLKALVIYRRAAGVGRLTTRALSPGEAFLCILEHTVGFDHGPLQKWPVMLERLRQAADEVPVEEVTVPSGPAGLEQLIAWIVGRIDRPPETK